MKTKRAVIFLALACLFLAILLPPEAYPDGKLAVILAASFAFFSLLVERRLPRSYLRGGLLCFGALLTHTFIFSIDAYRSLEFISVLWAYYCLVGFFMYAGFEPIRPVAVSMVVLSAIVSLYGLYQYFWGFEVLHNYVTYSGTSDILKVPALQRIATARVFSTLALPGTLWGFLAIALPFHAVLWDGSSRLRKTLLTAGVVLLLTTGFLTRSFGFLVGLLTLAMAWILLRHRERIWNRFTLIVMILVVVGGMFYSARRVAIADANPVSLRAMNWISAWTIFAAHPMGTGLNTYGIAYSQYMLPGANETQYAHNTPLQVLSELGYPVLIVGALILLWMLGALRHRRFQHVSRLLLLSIAVWVVHNLIDIDVYFGSVGVLGAVLIGLLLRNPASDQQPIARMEATGIVAFGLALLVFSGLVMVSSELQYRSQAEFEENKLQEAAQTLEMAKSIMPFNSSILHDYGDISLNLYHRKHQSESLGIATQAFQRAIELSPEKVGPHIGLSLCLSSAGQLEEAIRELRIAERLQPDSNYIQAIARLLDKRIGESLN